MATDTRWATNKDVIRAGMVVVIFIGLAFLVYVDKMDSTVIVGFIGVVGGYYFKSVEANSKQE